MQEICPDSGCRLPSHPVRLYAFTGPPLTETENERSEKEEEEEEEEEEGRSRLIEGFGLDDLATVVADTLSAPANGTVVES